MSDFKPVSFVDADAQGIEQELIKSFQRARNQQLYPGDPRRIFLMELLPILVALKNDINATGNATLLPFASDNVLDVLGVRVGVTRLSAQPARTRIKFLLSAVQSNAITIPKGTRVTPDGVIYFYTVEDVVIASGLDHVIVDAISSEGGSKYNGYLPGQINLLVDPIPFVSEISNLDSTTGGTDAETDEAFRERQRLAPASFSVAGPEGAYVYHAKSADVRIVDVSVISPSPCEVEIYLLLANGELPDQALLDKVRDQVSAFDKRPLTDHVQALVPDIVDYTIDLTYYIAKERSAEESVIRGAVEGPDGAVDRYVSWQQSKLGRPITPDYLVSQLYASGAFRVVATNPVYTEIDANQVAKLSGIKKVVYGGMI